MVSFLNTVVATFLGASAAFGFAMWKASADRRAEFRRQQLTEFYSPIAGYARRVRALLAMSQKVLAAKEYGWRDVLAPYQGSYTEKIEDDSQRFSKITDYESAQLDEELLPAYRAILEVFTAKYALATPATRNFYDAYYAFVNHWERVKREALPIEVREHIPHDAKLLHSFLEHLESALQTLQDDLR